MPAGIPETMALYHYCSTQAFHSIVTTGTLRLSSLAQSNDYLEGKLVAQAISRLATADSLGERETARLQTEIDWIETIIDALGFCLSKSGDLLSQWRGYAHDGTGVAIGFSESTLRRLASKHSGEMAPRIRLAKVEYKLNAHDELVRPTYQKVKSLMNSQDWSQKNALAALVDETAPEKLNAANMNISRVALSLVDQLFLLKSPGFKEEREYRLITHTVNNAPTPSGHRPTTDRLIPYRTLQLKNTSRSPFAHVVLGPKHRTPVAVVRQLLSQSDFGDVNVTKSKTSYR